MAIKSSFQIEFKKYYIIEQLQELSLKVSQSMVNQI